MKELVIELFSENAESAIHDLQLMDNDDYEDAIDASVFLLSAAKRSNKESYDSITTIIKQLCELELFDVADAYKKINGIEISAFSAWTTMIFLEDVLLEYEDRYEQ